MKKHIEERVAQLKKSLESIQNNANAHIGAIQELERILKEWDDGIPTSNKVGSDTTNVSSDPS